MTNRPAPPLSTDPSTPSLGDRLRTLPQYLYPQRLISNWAYWLTRLETPWLRNRLIRAFIRHFQVDMSEAQEPDPGQYATFNAFFTRAIRHDARPLIPGETIPCCPVDGFVSQAGNIDADTVFQAKGRSFSLTALLGGEPDRAQPFLNGAFATLYLSPRDYHRIHMPLAGRLTEMVHIPGKLFSVSPLTTRVVPGLFARNERVVTLFDTALGPMALILVGAINVGSMETVWAGAITPHATTRVRRWTYPSHGSDAVSLERGSEMGRFNMGSTVIVLFGPGAVAWNPALRPEARVQVGQHLATPRPEAP